ncbi:hypothetical protein HY642_01040 [Candidatus Woesearchaeota archaeon]|nr:hypothetical protein [Candidatus Woesearchaeota archaeon]
MEKAGKIDLKQQGKDCEWVDAHYAELAEKYPNQWIVVHKQRIVHHGPDLPDDAFEMGLVSYMDDGCSIL